MNDDTFEASLRDLARRTSIPDPTPEWKETILAAATAPPVRLLPPRTLSLSWAAAWVAIACFRWAGSPDQESPPLSAGPLAPPQSLFAYHEQLLLQLELP